MRPSQLAAMLGAALLACGCEAPRAGPDAPATRAQPARIAARALAPFAARVEAVRGLRFLHPVAAQRIPQADVRALLERELDRAISREQIARETELATSLGLLPPGFDLRASVLAFQTEAAAGFYSPLGGRLYIVDGAASAGGESVDALFVHELTHALQAQRSGVFEALVGIEGDDDLMFALTALLEGEATFVELADAAAQGDGQRPTPAALARRFRTGAVAPELPRVLAESVVAPYRLGYALVDALVARGGPAAIDAAHAAPPLSSEELLHPELYLRSEGRAPLAELVRDPALPGCRALATNCYGELSVRAWLEELGAAPAAASAAAAGWASDRAWRFDCAGRGASGWLLEYDDEREASELHAQLVALGPTAFPAGPPVFARRGARVLVSRGLEPADGARLLAVAEARRFATLADYLAAHPEVRERVRRLRSE